MPPKKPKPKPKPKPKLAGARARRQGGNPRADNLLPGVQGRDYTLVRHGNRFYVVYKVRLPNGKNVNLSWRVKESDLDTFGLNRNRSRRISSAEFKALNQFGTADEIQRRGEDKHPFDKFLDGLREVYGKVSWLEDEDYMAVLLMGHAEGWSEAELTERLRRTKWFQKRTEAQRAWEFDLTEKERKNALKQTDQQVKDLLSDLYGTIDWRLHVNPEDLDKWVTSVASGEWGDPGEGLAFLEARLRRNAEGIEGSQAWVDHETELEDQRAFMNRPEDQFELVRAEALRWLGPQGRPDQATLWQWAKDMVSGVRSDADFQQFLQRQAQALYPWLDTDEPWQDRASAYKSIAEQDFGAAIGFDHDILSNLGFNDADGNPTGAALTFDQFRQRVRQRDEFWHGSVAREEGFNLLSFLNNAFSGVG